MLLLAALVPAALGSVTFEDRTFYFGDLHVHTGYSGDGGSSDLGNCATGCGAFADLVADARADGLDFVSITEHANGSATADEAGFAAGLDLMLSEDDPDGGFVTVPGAELWFDLPGKMLGHKNLYFWGTAADLAALTLEDVRFAGDTSVAESCDRIWAFMDDLAARWGDVLLVPHHTALGGGMGTDWTCHDDPGGAEYSPAAEVYSRHGDSTVCPSAFDPAWIDCMEEGTAAAALGDEAPRLKIGFLGGTDAHDTRAGGVCALDAVATQHPYGGGLTVAVLPAGERFDRGALFEAIRDRRTYATSGPLIAASVEVSVDGAVAGGMGDEIAVAQGAAIDVAVRVRAEDAGAVTGATLVAPSWEQRLDDQGGGVFSARLPAGVVPIWAYVRLAIDGEAWYGEPPCEDGGADAREVAWFSPTWFTGEPADSGLEDSPPPDACAQCDPGCTCTCRAHERGCGFLAASGFAVLAGFGLPLALGRRARRRHP